MVDMMEVENNEWFLRTFGGVGAFVPVSCEYVMADGTYFMDADMSAVRRKIAEGATIKRIRIKNGR